MIKPIPNSLCRHKPPRSRGERENFMVDGKTSAIIAISILFALAASFSYYQYSQSLLIEREKNNLQNEKAALEQEKSAAVSEAENLRISLEEMQSKEQDYQNKIGLLTRSNSWYESRNRELQDSNDELIQENVRLRVASTQTLTLKPLDPDKLKLNSQTSEVIFYRQLQVYNYKTGEQWSFYWEIPFQNYYYLRINTEGHNLPYVDSADSIQYYQTSLGTWKSLTKLAEGLRKYSGNDEELYANMVLQVTHQFLYKPTDNTKYPIETFVEGSGDCDTLAVFAAALMKAGGLDSAIIYGTANGSQEDQLGLAHAMVGVNLTEKPDDQFRQYTYYMSDSNNGKTYYLAEATWGSGVFVKPWDYSIIGSAVGDSPWADFEGVIVETPNG